MKLKCRINGKEMSIVQGASFVENFNETLDSGVIVIDQTEKLSLKPYDDVFIWDDGEEFSGYINKGDYIEAYSNSKSPIQDSSHPTATADIVDTDPITGNALFESDEDDLRSADIKYRISGEIAKLWLYRFFEYDSSTYPDLFRYESPNVHLLVGVNLIGQQHTSFRKMGIVSTTQYYTDQSKVFIGDGTYFANAAINFNDKTILFGNTLFAGSASEPTIAGTIVSVSWDEDYEVKVTENIGKGIEFSTEVEGSVPENGFNPFSSIKLQARYMGDEETVFIDPSRTRLVWHTPTTGSVVLPNITLFGEEIPNLSFEFDNSRRLIRFSLASMDAEHQISDSSVINHLQKLEFAISSLADYFSPLPTGFFKHLLVNSFSEERLSLNDAFDSGKTKYRYTINLFSETKKLEKVMLPNVSITQSLVQSEKRSCWFYLNSFLEQYSPKYKKALSEGDKTWRYVNKYSVSAYSNPYLEGKNGFVTDLKSIFENTICPEMTLTNPSLKDLISQIMVVKDLIPVVFNDVIYGLDIGKTSFKAFNRLGMSFDVGNMSSNSYATDARREYSGALSQENSAHLVEYLGFRSPGSAFLDLSTMVLQTRYPIYKINSIKMCYYKAYRLSKDPIGAPKRAFLCKYDITPLVLQNTVRNTLSTNWKSFVTESGVDYSSLDGDAKEQIRKVAQYKLCTIGYDIGSNTISGWGTSYEYLRVLWFREKKTYIENIIGILEHASVLGTEINETQLLEGHDMSEDVEVVSAGSADSIIPFSSEGDTNIASKLKSIVFEVDYNAFYSGAVIHDKDNIDDDDIVTADNCTSSLTVLEQDGIFEKEKMNRMSNETYKFTARYDADNCGGKENVTLDKVQELASIDSQYTNAIIYTREYQIYDNLILANYEAVEEYVLKNYFTSVWAKYRTYSLMSYGESINRAENVRQFVLLSADRKYYETENLLLNGEESIADLMSFVSPTSVSEYGKISTDGVINCAYFSLPEGEIEIEPDSPLYPGGKKLPYGGLFLSDVNTFASGNSLCMNLAMSDNVSGGEYIQSYNTDLTLITEVEDAERYKATQGWHLMLSSMSDAFSENVGIYVCHLDSQAYYGDGIIENASDVVNSFGPKISQLPKINREMLSYSSKTIGSEFKINKDNKERLNFTFQFDYIADGRGKIVLSPWVAKLNDMSGVYRKFAKDTFVTERVSSSHVVPAKVMAFGQDSGSAYGSWKKVVVEMSLDDFESMNASFDDGKMVSLVGAQFGSFFLYADFGLIPIPLEGPLAFTHRYVNDIISIMNFTEMTRTGDAQSGYSYSLKYDFACSGRETSEHWLAFIKTNTTYYDTPVYFTSKNIDQLEIRNREVDGISVVDIYFLIPEHNMKDPFNNLPVNYDWRLPFGEQRVIDEGGPNRYNTSYVEASADLDSLPKNEKPCNMILIRSDRPVSSADCFDDIKMIDEKNVSLPAGMHCDTPNINGAQSGHYITEIFVLSGTEMTVRASEYSEYADTMKSISYYYRDDNNWLHFVMGVNLEPNESGGFDDVQVHISCVSKRNMAVYDSMHNRIGKAADYAQEENAILYGKGQYYTEEE